MSIWRHLFGGWFGTARTPANREGPRRMAPGLSLDEKLMQLRQGPDTSPTPAASPTGNSQTTRPSSLPGGGVDDLTARLVRNSRGLHERTPEIMRELLVSGAQVDAEDENQQTPLIRAAWVGNAATIQVLLTFGANIQARNWEGKTALMAAVINGHVDAVKVLIAAGAEIAATCNAGYTALDYAVSLGIDRQAIGRLLRF